MLAKCQPKSIMLLWEQAPLLALFLAEFIGYLPLILLVVCFSQQPSSQPIWNIRMMTLKSKISSMATMEMHPFWPYSYILWKGVCTNTWYMCIILVANIIRPFLWISPLSSIVAYASSQVSMSQQCNIIFLAMRFMGRLFGC